VLICFLLQVCASSVLGPPPGNARNQRRSNKNQIMQVVVHPIDHRDRIYCGQLPSPDPPWSEIPGCMFHNDKSRTLAGLSLFLYVRRHGPQKCDSMARNRTVGRSIWHERVSIAPLRHQSGYRVSWVNQLDPIGRLRGRSNRPYISFQHFCVLVGGQRVQLPGSKLRTAAHNTGPASHILGD